MAKGRTSNEGFDGKVSARGPVAAGASGRETRYTRTGSGIFLQGLGAEIIELERNPAANLAEDDLRYENRTRFGQALQPGRHVDPIAEQIVILDHDVAQVDPHANDNPPVFRQGLVGSLRRGLERDRALDGVDGAGEFHEDAIAHGLDQAAMMLRQERLKDRFASGIERSQRPRLIHTHEAAVADHIGHQDRSKPALHLKPLSMQT